MKTQHIVVVTGMHRSGTSGVAGLVKNLGVNLGEDIGSAEGNKLGFNEDVEFFELHNKMLRQSNQSILVQDIKDVISPNDEIAESAESLIKAREDLSSWGWKNPRTALYLKFWDDRIPEARYLFVYRHPVEVVLSLLRRGADIEALADPLVAFQSWQTHNRSILDFLKMNSSRCCLCNISEVAESVRSALGCFSEKLGLPGSSVGIGDEFDSSLLNKYELSPEDERRFGEAAPRTLALYRELEEAADLPGSAAESPSTPVVTEQSGSETNGPKIIQLLKRIDPELMAGIPEKLLKRCRELREAKFWWEEHCNKVVPEQALQISALEEANAWWEKHFNSVVTEQALQISALEESKDWWVEHFASVETERAIQISDLEKAKAWWTEHFARVEAERAIQISDLEKAKTWWAEHFARVETDWAIQISGLEESNAWWAEHVKRLEAEQASIVSGLEESNAWWAEHVKRLEAEQASIVSGLEEANAWLKGQVESWQRVVAHREGVVAELKSYVTEMEVGKRWLEGQVESLRESGEASGVVVAEQVTQITRMEKQIQSWRGRTEASEHLAEGLRSQLVKMEENWRAEVSRLEGQIEDWRAEVKKREHQLQELTAEIDQLEEGKARWRRLAEERQVEIESLQGKVDSIHGKLSECQRRVQQHQLAVSKGEAVIQEQSKKLSRRDEFLGQLEGNFLFRCLTYLRLFSKRDFRI